MKKEYTGSYIECDCCHERIEQKNPFYVTNTLKYNKTSIKVNEMDLCNSCCIMILENLFQNKSITEEQIKDTFSTNSMISHASKVLTDMHGKLM